MSYQITFHHITNRRSPKGLGKIGPKCSRLLENSMNTEFSFGRFPPLLSTNPQVGLIGEQVMKVLDDVTQQDSLDMITSNPGNNPRW